MSFHVTHRRGNIEKAPPSAFHDLLQELDANPEDQEHTSVSVTHESEWCLGAYRGGYLVFENLEDGEPRHMTDVPPEKIMTLWQRLADGDLGALESEPWKPGY
jgi:hypothetical protein